jgi:hypothetical protein
MDRMSTIMVKTSSVKNKDPLLGAPNVEVVYNTFSGTTARAAREGSFMKGLRLSRLNQDGHGGLCVSGYRSVIPYVHGEDCCIVVYVLHASIELA